MTAMSDETLRSKIERSKQKFEILTDGWDSQPDSQQRKLYAGIGQQARKVGIYLLLLNDVVTGTDWLVRSSEWYLRARRARKGEINEVQMLLWTLLTAILSRDEKTIVSATKSAVEIQNRNPEYFYHFDRCLVGLIDRDDETVVDSAKVLTNCEKTTAEELDYYPGLGTACEAIVAGNDDQFEQELETILHRHEALVPRLGETMDDALVCIPASALLVVARKWGIQVERLDAFRSEYVPLALFK